MDRYPPIEPYEQGMLDVGDGHQVFWEQCGNPAGKPVVVLHGGPGTGCSTGMRRWFDPASYRIVLVDQRNCGRSIPSAAEPEVDLASNTTQHLIADLERLRSHLGIDRWMLWGGSWGSTLALAYAIAHPERVSEMVLVSIVATTAGEVEWVTRSMGRVFPAQWERFRNHLPEADRDGNLAAGYHRLLMDPDPAVHGSAAVEWCRWEDTYVATFPGYEPDPRYEDPRFRLCFARIVTHYWAHGGFLPDGWLDAGLSRLQEIPAVLVHGRLDVSGPPDVAWHLAQRWPSAELVLVDDAGHGGGDTTSTAAILAATRRFADR